MKQFRQMIGVQTLTDGQCVGLALTGPNTADVEPVSWRPGFYCPKGYGECENAGGCCYPGRCPPFGNVATLICRRRVTLVRP